jgi:hypothetical protein
LALLYGRGVVTRRSVAVTFGARVMQHLTRVPGWLVFAGFLVWFVGWSVVAALVLDAVVPAGRQESLAVVAAPIVPALGALFAFLTAFAINTEWGQLRDAQYAAELEGDAAARFALVAESPGLDGPHLRGLLHGYLRDLLADEWPRLHLGRGSETARDSLAMIFRETRRIVADPATGVVTGTDLLGAVDTLVSLRRDRLALASRTMPSALLLLAGVSGVVLCLDAVLIALPHGQWEVLTVGGVVVVTALSLALIVAISAPYRGTISVDSRPVELVMQEVARGDLGAIGPP